METGSKPNEVWLEQHRLTDISTRDLTMINVVTDAVFPKMEFVDPDTQLMFSNGKRFSLTICYITLQLACKYLHMSGGSTHTST
jgi:hypothetical protein